MKLLKNRGDFYISQAGKGKTKQAKILLVLLAMIVIFTVLFFAFIGHRYNTVAEFFGKGEVEITEALYEDEKSLPAISGKVNYLICETDDEDTVLHYVYLLQADKNNLAYKVAALEPSTRLEDTVLSDIYQMGGGAALQKQLMEYFGFDIDYYAVFKKSSFAEFVSKLGSLVYSSNEEIRYSAGEEDDKYALHINEGEQKISGTELSNLIRYFSEQEQLAQENELVLNALTALFNEANYQKADSLFRLFVKSCKTDITVRNFENEKNSVMVFCSRSNDITKYSVNAEYEDGALTQASQKNIKGYFGQ